MRYGSVCSGIEAASVAWDPLGWKAAWYSEIESFPSAVLKHRWPDVVNLGDMTRFKEWKTDGAAGIDLLVGGTPCQSFSVAGLRKGLDDPRGNLMLTYLAIAGRLRPRWVVWENVPGVLSIDKGKAFGTFLGALGELGYGFAYRIFDAQYVRVESHARAVPQRRRRVFVVGYLGDWRRAAAVLFERESLSGHPPPRRQARQDVAPSLAARTRGGGGLGTDFDCDGGLVETSHPLKHRQQTMRPEEETYVPDIVPQAMSSKWSKGSSGPAGDEVANLIAHSLRGEGHDASEDGTGRGVPLVAGTIGGGSGARGYANSPDIATFLPIGFSSKDSGADDGEVSPTLRGMGHDGSHANGGGQLAVAFEPGSIARRAGPTGEQYTVSTLRSDMGDNQPAVRTDAGVRRLTPRECERLQGFPDDSTLIPMTKKKSARAAFYDPAKVKWSADGPRYKALGNSMAVNVMAWIGRRIQAVEDLVAANIA